MASKLVERIKAILGLTITADVTAGSGVVTPPISLANFQKALFLLTTKTGGTNTGTVKVTVEACDNTTPSNITAIDFVVNKNESAGTSDAMGAAVSCVAATGFNTVANKTALYEIEVRADKVAETGYGYVRLKLTPVVVDAVLGHILVIGADGPEGSPDSLPTAIV